MSLNTVFIFIFTCSCLDNNTSIHKAPCLRIMLHHICIRCQAETNPVNSLRFWDTSQELWPGAYHLEVVGKQSSTCTPTGQRCWGSLVHQTHSACARGCTNTHPSAQEALPLHPWWWSSLGANPFGALLLPWSSTQGIEMVSMGVGTAFDQLWWRPCACECVLLAHHQLNVGVQFLSFPHLRARQD